MRGIAALSVLVLAATLAVPATAGEGHKPRLEWTTRSGGQGASSLAAGVAVGPDRSVYVVGSTYAPDFPARILAGGYRRPRDPGIPHDFGIGDAVVTKLSPSGEVLWSVTIGGRGDTQAAAVAVDLAGRAYVVGSTSAPDYPTTSDALQHGSSDGEREFPRDAFLTILDADGSGIAYSTYLGGSSYDAGRAVALDTGGRIYVAGQTASEDFPVRAALQPEIGRRRYGYVTTDAFITVLEAGGAGVTYSTFLGGDGEDYPYSIAVDGSRAVYVGGYTESLVFPTTPGAFQATFPGTSDQGYPTYGDGFLAKIEPDGRRLAYSTYFGAVYRQAIAGVAVDGSGCAHVVGWNDGPRLPTTPTSFMPARPLGGAWHGFAAKLTADGSGLVYSSWIGGEDPNYNFETIARGAALDARGNLYVVGSTRGDSFPVRKAFQRHNATGPFDINLGGEDDAFVLVLDAKGRRLRWSSFLGGEHDEWAGSVALDPSGAVVVAGATSSASLGACPSCDTTTPRIYHLFASRIRSRVTRTPR